jgi:hypothetical protein
MFRYILWTKIPICRPSGKNPVLYRGAFGIFLCFHSMSFPHENADPHSIWRVLRAVFEARCHGIRDILWVVRLGGTGRISRNVVRTPGIDIRRWASFLSFPGHFCSAFRAGLVVTGNTSLVRRSDSA